MTPFSTDPPQHVTAQAVRRGIGESGDLVHLGDGRAGDPNRGRGGAAGVPGLQVDGDVGRGGRDRLAPVLGSPALPCGPSRSVRLAGVGRERGEAGVDALLRRGAAARPPAMRPRRGL